MAGEEGELLQIPIGALQACCPLPYSRFQFLVEPVQLSDLLLKLLVGPPNFGFSPIPLGGVSTYDAVSHQQEQDGCDAARDEEGAGFRVRSRRSQLAQIEQTGLF